MIRKIVIIIMISGISSTSSSDVIIFQMVVFWHTGGHLDKPANINFNTDEAHRVLVHFRR